VLIAVISWPRSGQVWLVRMLAQVLDCPVHTWLPQDTGKDVALEGVRRTSEYRVTRAHGISDEYQPPADYYIHLTRDPRDVAVSNAFYWDPKPGFARNLQGCVDQVSEGWDKFTTDMWSLGHVTVRYEDLMNDTAFVLRYLITGIGALVEDDHIRHVVSEQAWAKKLAGIKDKTAEHGWDEGAALRHMGQVPKLGRWREHLSLKQRLTLERACRNGMSRSGYDPER
jgi:hypothetical protein